MIENSFGRKGSPWEFNLRDVFRWCDLLLRYPHSQPGEFVDLLYLQRMRSLEDRQFISTIYNEVFGEELIINVNPEYHVNPSYIQIGRSILSRQLKAYSPPPNKHNIQLLHHYLNVLESVMTCVDMNWMTILTGNSSSGKTSIVRLLSHLTRNTLHEFSMNTAVDTTELLGGFEQLDLTRYKKIILEEVQVLVSKLSEELLVKESASKVLKEIHDIWSLFIVRFKFAQNSTQRYVHYLFGPLSTMQ